MSSLTSDFFYPFMNQLYINNILSSASGDTPSTNIDKLLNNLYTNMYLNNDNVAETDTQYKYSFNVPGYTKDHIKVKLNKDRTIAVSAHYQTNNKKRSFNYSTTLPKNVDLNSLDGKVENGVLVISVNKTEQTDMTERYINLN